MALAVKKHGTGASLHLDRAYLGPADGTVTVVSEPDVARDRRSGHFGGCVHNVGPSNDFSLGKLLFNFKLKLVWCLIWLWLWLWL